MGTTAVTGVSDHYGYAILVSVALAEGEPAIIDLRQAALRDPDLPGSPYHHDTLDMPEADADALLARVRDAVARLAREALQGLSVDLAPAFDLSALSIRQPPLPHLPMTAAEAHADYRVQCAADGMLYHHYLCEAAREMGVPVHHRKRGKELEDAARAMGCDKARIEAWLKAEGKRLGPPWQKDHMLAAAGGLAALAQDR